MLRRSHSQRRLQPCALRTAFGDLPEGQQRLIPAGVEALRNPEMERRVRAHLEARDDSPDDVIAATLLAARFHREQNGLDRGAESSGRNLRASQSA